MLQPISKLAFRLMNKFLKYIKKLTFGFHEFSVIFPSYTISNAKIKLMTPSSGKIRAATIQCK